MSSNSENKMDYQKTLNLPKTDFSMKANLAQKEPTVLKSWEDQGLYQELCKKNKGKPTFVLHDGPPYANGHIHIGHALNKILKDMVIKFKTLDGYDTPYTPGWDCHGLPIEHALFKELKTHKSKVECMDIRKKAHDYAMKFVEIQKEEFIRLGVFADWKKPYLTLDKDYEYWILKSLSSLTKKEFIYRGLKPVNWCFDCETALAEAEVEYEDHVSPSVFVKFKVNNPELLKDIPKGKNVYLLIWTTTPWTLLANVAVAVHPTYTYVLADMGNEILIAEQSLWSNKLRQKMEPGSKETICGTVNGNELKKLVYTHPFGIRENCRVVTVDYVTREDGTGLVHTAPGHGQEDFQTGLANNLEVLMPVNQRGVFTEEGKQFAGEHVFKANEKIIADLKERGILFAQENLTHSYPHCWRCKKPIIFRATEQWFLKIDHNNLRGQLKDAIKSQVQWIPEAGEERILGMVTTRPDWCLSRQRFWGVPIPAVTCKGCADKHKLFSEVIDSFAELVRKDGSNAWFEKDIKEIVPNGFKCPDCGKGEFGKTNDILDVWFDSGVSHQAVVKAMLSLPLPADLYLEGSDQHRGWFQSSLIPSVAIEGKPPFKGVLTHGFVVDGQGRKMSKSLGNVVAPQDIIKNYGADILRLWVASSNYNDDIRISKEILDRLIDAYRKIRNTIRFLLSNLDQFNPDADSVSYDQMQLIDQWAMYRLSYQMDTIKAFYESYDFAMVYKSLYSFCNEDLSSIYLDIIKDRLYTSHAHSPERRSAQMVLYHIVNSLVRIMSPVLSFTSEEIFSIMPKAKDIREVQSVHLLSWPVIPEAWKNGQPDQKLKIVLELRPHVLKALEEKRRDGTIGSSLESKLKFSTTSDRDFAYLEEFKSLLPSIFIVSQVDINRVSQIDKAIGEQFTQTAVLVEPAEGQKCQRCWNYSAFVGKDLEHPTVCDRCLSIIKEILNGK